MAIELKKGVYWVGAVDWGVRQFHGHELSTHRGTSYNSYLVVDEKIALIDTVKHEFADKLLENIREIIDPAKIDIVVFNHAEMDHSGSIKEIMYHAPQAQLVASKRGVESMEGHFHQSRKWKAVGTGDSIELGRNTLVFVEAPMLHWPDTQFTYLEGSNLLLSNDAFGQHYATAFRFNDEVDQKELYEEALKYYVNILTPFSKIVEAKIKELLELKWKVDMIAPSHGVIWRKDPLQIVRKYRDWAAQKPEASAVILYGTMWNGTRRMAEAIAEGIAAEGVSCKLFDLAVSDRNDVLVEVFRARTLILGSPTLNQGILSHVLAIMGEIKGLKFKNKIGAAFGCYGWSGGSVKIIEDNLKACGFPLVKEGLRCKWQPGARELEECRKFGRELALETRKPEINDLNQLP